MEFLVSGKKNIAVDTLESLDTLISSPHLKLEIRVVRAKKLVGYRTSSNTFLVNHELIPLY